MSSIHIVSAPPHQATEDCFSENVARIKGMQSRVLNPREMRIVKLLAVGLSNKQIAVTLSLGDATVKMHIKYLGRKLELRRRGEICAWFWVKHHSLRYEAVVLDEGHYFKRPEGVV